MAARNFELDLPAKRALADSPIMWFGDPANMEIYNPQPRQRIPVGGAWAMITRRLPAIEGDIDRHARVGRIFYIEQLPNADEAGFLPDGSYKALSRTPWGSLYLWPYEYSVMETRTAVALWSSGEIIFHPINVDSAKLSLIAFYARSRGIGLADAAVMALGTLNGPVGWFEPCSGLAAECESMERRVHRRLQSRKRS